MPHREPNGPAGPFEAISITPRGRYIRTRHHSLASAHRRLLGCPRHTACRVIDHTPRKGCRSNAHHPHPPGPLRPHEGNHHLHPSLSEAHILNLASLIRWTDGQRVIAATKPDPTLYLQQWSDWQGEDVHPPPVPPPGGLASPPSTLPRRKASSKGAPLMPPRPGLTALATYKRAKYLVVETSDAGENQLNLLLMATLLAALEQTRRHVKSTALAPLVNYVDKAACSPDYWYAAFQDLVSDQDTPWPT